VGKLDDRLDGRLEDKLDGKVCALAGALAIGATLLANGCSTPDAQRVEPRPSGAFAAGPVDGVVLGSLQTNDETLRIVATAHGPRYSVSARDGQLLSQNLTLDELARRHGALHDAMQSGTAKLPSSAPYLDATLDQPASEPADTPR
jgi:hypothetical protein